MLSKKSKYAFHALVYIARREQAQHPVSAREVAEAESIPHKFLEAILRDLTTAGILRSVRGKGGGYRLAKAPDQIHLGQIMRLFDGPIALLPCVSLNYYMPCEECRDETTCSIRRVFLEIRQTTLRILGENTLQHIIDHTRDH